MNVLSLIISILTVCLLIISVIFFPKVKIKKVTLQSFWIASLFGMILLIITGVISLNEIKEGIFREGSINPIKILVLFFSMTILSIILDEEGFFSYLAGIVSEKCRRSQIVLMISFYNLHSFFHLLEQSIICYLEGNSIRYNEEYATYH